MKPNLKPLSLNQRQRDFLNKFPPRDVEALHATIKEVVANYDIEARKGALSKIIDSEIEMPISASHVIAAISEFNKMEHIYEPEARNVYNDIKVLVVREKPRQIPEDTTPLSIISPEPEVLESQSNSVIAEVVEDTGKGKNEG